MPYSSEKLRKYAWWKTTNEDAEYEGRKVTLNKPFRDTDGGKKFAVYVRNDKGNIVKVRFGDANMEIKRDDPERRKSFRARHNCDQKNDKTTPGYWSCKTWQKNKTVSDIVETQSGKVVVDDINATPKDMAILRNMVKKYYGKLVKGDKNRAVYVFSSDKTAKNFKDSIKNLKVSGLKVELMENKLEEQISRSERLKRSQRMRRKSKFLHRRAQIASKRMPSMEKLKKRARKLAIHLLKKRIAKKDLKGLSVAEKNRIEQRVANMGSVVDRIARKMLPKLKQHAMQRMRKRSSKEAESSAHQGTKNESVQLDTPQQKRYTSDDYPERIKVVKESPISEYMDSILLESITDLIRGDK